MLLPGPDVCHGSLYGLPLLLSLSPHSAMLPLSGLLTLLVVSIFGHRVLYGLPIAAASTATHSGSTLWFWPRDCPNEVKCAVILRSTALICMSY
ncbi:unnamed protein product [Staurois parvus]|uniref:Uncharacterized protein n=1 Tax=Staurois parvus TaxID=386267 RepID=A0ABN9B0Z2_9NEOB|nr:unnamed protein product [Staurois parvus]